MNWLQKVFKLKRNFKFTVAYSAQECVERIAGQHEKDGRCPVEIKVAIVKPQAKYEFDVQTLCSRALSKTHGEIESTSDTTAIVYGIAIVTTASPVLLVSIFGLISILSGDIRSVFVIAPFTYLLARAIWQDEVRNRDEHIDIIKKALEDTSEPTIRQKQHYRR